MFNRLIKYNAWIRKWQDDLVSCWECGFHSSGDQITEQTYEDFVANQWASYQESEVDNIV